MKRIIRFIKNLHLAGKLRLLLAGTVLVVLLLSFVIPLTVGFYTLENLERSKLKNVCIHKQALIRDYFKHVGDHVATLANDPFVIEALKDFSRTFYEIPLDSCEKHFSAFGHETVSFYEQGFYPKYESVFLQKLTEKVIPDDRRTLFFQYHYLVKNPYKISEKHKMVSASTYQEMYDAVHAHNHNFFKKIIERYGYYDFFLIDTSGYIVYTVFKETDFATSLLHGPYKESELGKLVADVLRNGEKDKVYMSEYGCYTPSYGSPASFMASPIFDVYNRKIGVLAIQLPKDKIQEVMTDNQQWAAYGMGFTGESYLISDKGYMCSDSRMLIENKSLYLKKMQDAGMSEDVLNRISSLNTNILLQKAPNIPDNSKEFTRWTTNYSGEKVLSAYQPLPLFGKNWGVVTEITSEEIFKPLSIFKWVIPILLISLLGFSLLLSTWQSKLIAKPIVAIKKQVEALAVGCIEEIEALDTKDELGQLSRSLKTLQDYLKKASDFAFHIGKGQFNYAFTPASEHDVLGNALLSMRAELEAADAERQKQNFINVGLNKCNELLQQNNADLDQMLDGLLAFIVRYTKAHQGGIYLVENETEQKNLLLKASYANAHKKFVQNTIEPGEGLVGQAFLEKDTIFITDVPQNYEPIASGLGFAKPKSIFICPLEFNDEQYGVLEIASLHVLDEPSRALIKEVSRLLASVLSKEIINQRMKQMLERNNEIMEQLRAQEEELRQNLEEMMATQEEMRRRELQQQNNQ